jgi:hypothetical protein
MSRPLKNVKFPCYLLTYEILVVYIFISVFYTVKVGGMEIMGNVVFEEAKPIKLRDRC